MLWLFWISVGFLLYTFAGYPLLVFLLSRLFGAEHRRGDIGPKVSVVVAVHNGASLLDAKIRNSLQLSYPSEKLEIIIVSDGSDDDTPRIARSYADSGIQLIELAEHRGKHHAQQVAIRHSRGDILVFTDVAVQLAPGAIQTMVANFADPSVGAVSSEDRILRESNKEGEARYVSLEMWLRRSESRLNSLVNVSGSFFAARREVCEVWHLDQSSDFFVALHTVAKGMRVVMDPNSIGYMGAVRDPAAEFRRKVRTIVHGMVVWFTHLYLLNPFRFGFFSVQLVSHKLFRWFTPLALAGLLVSSVSLGAASRWFQVAAAAQALFYLFGTALFVTRRRFNFLPLTLASFFVLGSLATVVAWVKFCSGETFALWRPSQRV